MKINQTISPFSSSWLAVVMKRAQAPKSASDVERLRGPGQPEAIDTVSVLCWFQHILGYDYENIKEEFQGCLTDPSEGIYTRVGFPLLCSELECSGNLLSLGGIRILSHKFYTSHGIFFHCQLGELRFWDLNNPFPWNDILVQQRRSE